MARTHTFRIATTTGTTLIEGKGYGINNTVITNLEGWDDGIIDVQTVPKLLGSGSYIISEKEAEKVITATFSLPADYIAARPVFIALFNTAKTKGQMVRLSHIMDTGTGPTLIEEALTGKIRNVQLVAGSAEESTIIVEIVCPDPDKTTGTIPR